MTLYNFAALNIEGDVISFDQFKGKVVIVVNTASECYFTYQYKELEQLYQKYKDQGLVILGFPCNQFANQEPNDEYTIKQDCLIEHHVSFPMFSKVDVNGKNAIALFKWLREELPGFLNNHIKWNFTKFIIDRDGKPVKRFNPIVSIKKVEKYLEKEYF